MIGDITYRWETNNLQIFAETLERRVYHRNLFLVTHFVAFSSYEKSIFENYRIKHVKRF